MNDHTTKEQTQAEKDKAQRIADSLALLEAINGPPRTTPKQRQDAQDKIKRYNDLKDLESLSAQFDKPYQRPANI